MTRARAAAVVTIALVAAGLAWILFVGLPRWYGQPAESSAAAPEARADEGSHRKIKARLFYVAETGVTLTAVERDIAFGESPTEQAKEIIQAQLGPATEGLLSALPPGTALRALFITPSGEAFVDFSSELAVAHPGGSLNEMLTVYTIVDALTVNLPAVKAVQVLVNGKEVDTLAGHVDLRRPLAQDLTWVQ